MYQENIHVLASLRFLHLNLEWQNIKLGRKTYEDLFFLFHENMFYVTIMQSDTTVVSIAVAFFNSSGIIIATNGQKTLHQQLNKVILSGMYNYNFEAVNYSQFHNFETFRYFTKFSFHLK